MASRMLLAIRGVVTRELSNSLAARACLDGGGYLAAWSAFLSLSWGPTPTTCQRSLRSRRRLLTTGHLDRHQAGPEPAAGQRFALLAPLAIDNRPLGSASGGARARDLPALASLTPPAIDNRPLGSASGGARARGRPALRFVSQSRLGPHPGAAARAFVLAAPQGWSRRCLVATARLDWHLRSRSVAARSASDLLSDGGPPAEGGRTGRRPPREARRRAGVGPRAHREMLTERPENP
jgi:hypothetical protein